MPFFSSALPFQIGSDGFLNLKYFYNHSNLKKIFSEAFVIPKAKILND